jgi:hypothetical protein
MEHERLNSYIFHLSECIQKHKIGNQSLHFQLGKPRSQLKPREQKFEKSEDLEIALSHQLA